MPNHRIGQDTFVDVLCSRASEHPERSALSFTEDGETDYLQISYATLDRQARAIGAQLEELLAPGDRALLLFPPGPEFVAAMYGCLYAGVVAVPGYPPHPARLERGLAKLSAIVKDAEPALALTTAALLPMIEAAAESVQALPRLRWLASDTVSESLAGQWKRPAIVPSTLALLQYTSGSTGVPKGVMVTHENLAANYEVLNYRGFSLLQRFVSWLPLYHDMGLIGFLLHSITNGASGTLMSPLAFIERPLRWLRAISRVKAQYTGAPDFGYALCARKIKPEETAGLDLSSWRCALSGAEPVRAATIEAFVATFADRGFRREAFYPAYGLAEATLIVTGGQLAAPPVRLSFDKEALKRGRAVQAASEDHEGQRFVGCGSPPPEHRIVIAHPDSSTPCEPGEVGEIWVFGPSVALGYWSNPEETRRSFHAYLAGTSDGPFLRTGDLGFLHQGQLFITGRLKDLIIIRGRNHAPQDLETTIEKCHARVRPGCAAAFSIEVGDTERVVIVAEINTRDLPARGEAREAALGEVLSAIPSAVGNEHALEVYGVALIEPATIHKTSSGKIQRRACRQAYLEGSLSIVASATNAARKNEAHDSARSERNEGLPDDPRVRTERFVVEQLERITGRFLKPYPELSTSLQALGLDSLLSLDLARRIEQELGVHVPVATMIGEGTFGWLVETLMQNTAAGSDSSARPAPPPATVGSLLAELRPIAVRPPFYCVGPVTGLVGILRHLARALASFGERPFYALLPPGMDGGQAPLRTIESLAARYIEEIRLLQPSGPYVVGGYSSGGVVAYEMARQLRAQRAEVTHVVLLDTLLPERIGAPVEASRTVLVWELLEMFCRISGQSEAPSFDELSRKSSSDQNALVKEALEQVKARLSLAEVAQLIDSYGAGIEAVHRYTPGPLEVPVTLFTAEVPLVMPLHPSRRVETYGTPGLGWEHVCPDVLHIRQMPGDHLSMLQPPHVDGLAALVASAVASAATAELRPTWLRSAGAPRPPRADEGQVPPQETHPPGDRTTEVYVGLADHCVRIDRRSTSYRFNLERDIPWQNIDLPGDHAGPAYFAAHGIDVKRLLASPAAHALFQWAIGLSACESFAAVEQFLVDYTHKQQHVLYPSRSIDWFRDEELKHIELFRRYASHLREQHPEWTALFQKNFLHDHIAYHKFGLSNAAYHLWFWLDAILFEEYSIYLFERLLAPDAARLQPTWLAVHAAHRQEEIQHLVTDRAHILALNLSDEERYRISRSWLEITRQKFGRKMGYEAVYRMVAALHPELATAVPDALRIPPWIEERLLHDRAFARTREAAPYLRELAEGRMQSVPANSTSQPTARRNSADAAEAVTFSAVHGNSAVIRAADLRIERLLQRSDIEAALAAEPASAIQRCVLLTGASGFLGRFLLLGLLDRLPPDGKVVCLLRAPDDAAAAERLRRAFSSDPALLSRFEGQRARLQVRAGDLLRPRLGLAPAPYDALCDEVDGIVHCAALVNHVLPYSELFQHNVMGTVEAMRLAARRRKKSFHFISSAVVTYKPRRATKVQESEHGTALWQDRPVDAGYAAGYLTSKWASEVLLAELHERFAVPVNVFRPSHLHGHRRYSGQINPNGHLTQLLRGIVYTGLIPGSFYAPQCRERRLLDLPVDFAADAIAAIALEPSRAYRTYHAIGAPDEQGASLDTLADWVRTAGYPLTRMADYHQWFMRFRATLASAGELGQRRLPSSLFHLWEQPYGTLPIPELDAAQFYAKLREVAPVRAAPQLNEAYLHRCLEHMVCLGLIPPPPAVAQTGSE